MESLTDALDEAASRAIHRGWRTRYRLSVIGHDAADTVASVGGFLCDQSMAGWDVKVYLQDTSNQRPLQIVGVRAVDLREATIGPTSEDWPDVVLIDAGLYRSQEWLRRHAAVAARRPATEVLLWGDEEHLDLSTRLRRSEHRMSIAAHAFKTSAVSAAGKSASPVGQTERLLCKKGVLTITSLTNSAR